MKKSRLLSVLLCLALLSGLLATFASAADSGSAILDEMDVNAKAAVLVDPDTGEILYEKNAHAHNYPASITKVMTCLLTLEAVDRESCPWSRPSPPAPPFTPASGRALPRPISKRGNRSASSTCSTPP